MTPEREILLIAGARFPVNFYPVHDGWVCECKSVGVAGQGETRADARAAITVQIKIVIDRESGKSTMDALLKATGSDWRPVKGKVKGAHKARKD